MPRPDAGALRQSRKLVQKTCVRGRPARRNSLTKFGSPGQLRERAVICGSPPAEARASTGWYARVGGGRSPSSSLRRPLMLSRLRTALSPLLLGLLASCTGAIGEGNGNPGSGGAGRWHRRAPAGGADPSGVGGADRIRGSRGRARADPGWRADLSRYVRLTHEQWENSVRDLLQLPALPGLSATFTGDPPERQLLQQRAPAVHDVGVVVRLRDRRRDAVPAGGARRDRPVAGHAAAPRSPRRSSAASAGAPTGAT